jgi:predicted transcriptional regulator
VLKNDQAVDWWEQISGDEKEEILSSIAEANKGEVFAHEEVISKYDKWRSK